MPAELAVVVIVETFDGGLLDRAVHPLDLAIRPGMLHLGQPVLDGVVAADAVKEGLEGWRFWFAVGKWVPVVGDHVVVGVGEGAQEVRQNLAAANLAGLLRQLKRRTKRSTPITYSPRGV